KIRVCAERREHGLRLLEATDRAGVGGVQQRRRNSAVGDLKQCRHQIDDVRRRSDLVGHHVDRLVAHRATPDARHEIIAGARVDPRSAHDVRGGQLGTHGLLAGELAAPVHRQRCRLVADVVRTWRALDATAEHVVGGDVDQPRAGSCAATRDVPRSRGVDRVRNFRVGFGGVDGREGRAVDHNITRRDDVLTCGGVGDVPLRRGQRQDIDAPAGGLDGQAAANLAAGAGDNDSVAHGFRVWHAGLRYRLPHYLASSLGHSSRTEWGSFVPAVPAGPAATARRGIRVLCTLVAITITLATGLAWGKFRAFEDGIFHMSSPLLGQGDDGAIDILLVGLDSRTDAHGNPLSGDELERLHAGDDVSTNTDTIILVRIPNNGKSATAISIPRDSYVEAPGLGKTKINGVYGQTKEAKREQLVESGVSDSEADAQSTEAGRNALIKTVGDLTGVTVDHYAEIGLL